MNRINRAAQFAPFDALKGLKEALKIKEYEHDKMFKGDLSEEKITKISNILLNNQKEKCKVTYFNNGYYNNIEGVLLLLVEKNSIEIGGKVISLDDIFDIDVL
jgi:hypothetical protein